MSAMPPLAGVIGYPIGHSKSPRLHGHWLSHLGLPGAYIAMEIAPENLAQVLAALPLAGFRGINVTLPHKEAALVGATCVTDRARRIGAANTLTFLPDGGYEADCTDGFGFIENLKAGAPDWQAAIGPVTVFGAGGASRAIVDALIAEGAPEIRLTNRTRARAEVLANDFGPCVKVIEWGQTEAALEGATTVVNTTSLGMQGQPPFDLDLSALRADAVATDIVYTPLDTPFLRAAADRGAQVVDGLGMLLWQGLPGFTRWFGGTPVVTDELRQIMLAP